MSAKQAIYDKLQGSVAIHLRYGGVVNNQIKSLVLQSPGICEAVVQMVDAMMQMHTPKCSAVTLYIWNIMCKYKKLSNSFFAVSSQHVTVINIFYSTDATIVLHTHTRATV